jgi:hypothetical protein
VKVHPKTDFLYLNMQNKSQFRISAGGFCLTSDSRVFWCPSGIFVWRKLYTHTHTHVYIYIYTYIYIYLYIYICLFILHTYIHAYIHTYVCVCVCVCARARVCVCVYIYLSKMPMNPRCTSHLRSKAFRTLTKPKKCQMHMNLHRVTKSICTSK